VKSATLRPAIQKLATARSVGAIYLWFVIGDSSTHLHSTKYVTVAERLSQLAAHDGTLRTFERLGRRRRPLPRGSSRSRTTASELYLSHLELFDADLQLPGTHPRRIRSPDLGRCILAGRQAGSVGLTRRDDYALGAGHGSSAVDARGPLAFGLGRGILAERQAGGVGSDDRTVKLWNAVTGALQQTLEAYSNSVTTVAFSPDGKLVALGSGDGRRATLT
jgi:hypothetical protein